MMLSGTGRRLRFTAVAAALLVALTACGGADPAPAPGATTSAPSTASSAPPAQTTAPVAEPPTAEAAEPSLTMAASTPVRVSIPAIDRTADLIETGIRDDRTLEVPPDEEGSPASWFTGSPTPGERGAAVLLGHVNSLSDDSGVFYDLQALQPGDEVSVTRADGSTAVFEVYRAESFAKDTFPTRAVYYPVPEAELRLITCDNLDGSSPGFPNNFVVFARLVAAE